MEPECSTTASLERLLDWAFVEEDAVPWLEAHLDAGVHAITAGRAGGSGDAWFGAIASALLDAPASLVDRVARDLGVGRDPLGGRQLEDYWPRWLRVYDEMDSRYSRSAVALYVSRELALRPRSIPPTNLGLLEMEPDLRRKFLREYAVRWRLREVEEDLLESQEKGATGRGSGVELEMLAAIRRRLASAEAEHARVVWVADASGLLRRRELPEEER